MQQKFFGRTTVDQLYMNEDSSTAIIAHLITGKTWKETYVMGEYYYTNPLIERLEKFIMRRIPGEIKTRVLREAIYHSLFRCKRRKYIKSDLKCKTLFDIIPNSKAIYVPAYNPEPSWCLDRLIFDIRDFPELGEEAAIDLIEKDLYWRTKKLFRELSSKPYNLLMLHLQTLDSVQHLYLVYTRPPRIDKVYEYYKRIDMLAYEIREMAKEKYDVILFLSEHGIPVEPPPHGRTYHLDRGFFSLNRSLITTQIINIRALFYHILRWCLAKP